MKTTLGNTFRSAVGHPAVGFDVIRIYLGVALFVRGVLFLSRPDRVFALGVTSASWFWPAFVAHYVGIAHLCGGVLLALGLATRLAAAVQVPVLLGAVFLVHWEDGLLRVGQSLELAALVLVMLIVYAIFGAGPLSVDERLLQKRLRESSDDEHGRRTAGGDGGGADASRPVHGSV